MTKAFKYSWLLILFLFTNNLISQTIEGSVSDIFGAPLNATIYFKEITKDTITKEYLLAEKGKYRKKLNSNYNKLLLEIGVNGYYKQTLTIDKPEKEKTYSFDFVLIKIERNELEEVVIVAKQKPFEIKEDTISFNVSRYIDGSERKIEEIISKLPGIELNEGTGQIKYKGKAIETVTLDGDNLFGYNYTLGTKNINVDMVEQIEAIDNYAENPLLKGIEQGGKVALNLKLKKGKADISGNIDFGMGRFDEKDQAYDLASNILGITKTYKSFATLSYNNVGANQTPFDYFGFSFNAEQEKEQNYFAEKVIPETHFSNIIDNSRANINDQFFGNYNAIYKINPNLSIKTNLYYLQDKITANQFIQNSFQINNDVFTTIDNSFFIKKPKQYRGDLEIKYNSSKTSLLEYKLRLKQENIETPTTVIQNQTDEYSTFLNTEDFYLKQDLLWTKKLSEKNVLQTALYHSFNNSPQIFKINPALFPLNAEEDTQQSNFKKTFLEGRTTYLGSSKRDKYTFSVGARYNNSPFTSRLFNSEETISTNDFAYTQNDIFNTGVYNFNRGKWQISPSYSVKFLNQKLDQNKEYDKLNKFIFTPALNLKYELNSISFILASLDYSQNTNTEQYFFLNEVLIDNRTTISNLPSLDLQNSRRYSLLYFNNSLYNQFQLNININYQKSSGHYFTNQDITENTTQIKYFFLPQNSSNWNMNTHISKYLPFIKSTFKLTSNYSTRNYINIVNNSDLRRNQSHFMSNSFFWKTAFEIPINFENTFSYRYSNSKGENQSAFINKAWQNTFKVIVKPNNKWFLIVSSDYYLPDTKQSKQNFLFLDATLRHKPKSKKWEANMSLRNLTNEKNFEQVQTSDIATSIYRSNLLPRYFLVKFTWNF